METTDLEQMTTTLSHAYTQDLTRDTAVARKHFTTVLSRPLDEVVLISTRKLCFEQNRCKPVPLYKSRFQNYMAM